MAWLTFTLLFFSNGMFWWEGEKDMKGIQKRKKEDEE
jgi:hypothetical protein